MDEPEHAGDICMKIHVQGGHRLLAACDRELLGSEHREGELHLNIEGSFYFDEFVDRETFLRFLKTVDMANLAGEAVVSAAVEAGYISEDCVLRIDSIPHAQLC